MLPTKRLLTTDRLALLRKNKGGRWSAGLRLGAGLLAFALSAGGVLAQDPEEIIPRSTRWPGHPFDELDLPAVHERSSGRGFEYSTRHFKIVAPDGWDQAESVAQDMERTWSELELLADHFTTRHRQPTFAIGAVGVWIDNHAYRDVSEHAPGPRVSNDSPDIYVSIAPGQPSLSDQMVSVREEAVRSFFRVAQLDQTLPDWVQLGLGAYVAREGAEPTNPVAAPGRPSETREAPQREVADRLYPTRSIEHSSADWVRFLLEGDDARLAPAFLGGVAALIANTPERQSLSPVETASFVEQLDGPAANGPNGLVSLVTDPSVRQRLAVWARDPLAGQPVYSPAPGLDAETIERQKEMVLVLKLARRAGKSRGPVGPRPEVMVWEGGGPKRIQAPVEEMPDFEPSRLFKRLLDPNSPAWATRDTNGRLLFSTDHARLEQLFGRPEVSYQTQIRDGHTVLVRSDDGGPTTEAWLENNPDNPERPWVAFRVAGQEFRPQQQPPRQGTRPLVLVRRTNRTAKTR
ncbi:MAG: hypothetical protein U0836_26365 [Pirellulales bacterium]